LSFICLSNTEAQYKYNKGKFCIQVWNSKNELIKDAKVSINGVKATIYQTKTPFGDEIWYEVDSQTVLIKDRYDYSQRIYLIIQHKDYQTYKDSTYLISKIALRKKNEGYIYQYNKYPMDILKDVYFVGGITDNEHFTQVLTKNNFKIVTSYQVCQDLKNDLSGPSMYGISVPRKQIPLFLTMIDSIASQKRVSIAIGLLTSSNQGISNEINFRFNQKMDKALIIKYAKSLPEVSSFQFDNFQSIHCYFRIKLEYLYDLVSITEKILASGYFHLPMNESFGYPCPD
jgi:hypothetical protein